MIIIINKQKTYKAHTQHNMYITGNDNMSTQR